MASGNRIPILISMDMMAEREVFLRNITNRHTDDSNQYFGWGGVEVEFFDKYF